MKSKFLVLISCFLMILSPAFSQSAGAPQAFKYQAVIRDAEGDVLADKTLNLRISLRRDHAVNGGIVYQEVHLNVRSNIFGMVHLEIGRGSALSANGFEDVEWGTYPLYVQIEVEINSSGYTSMGSGELLSVPYALYAENGGNASVSYDNLNDTYLPKYDQTSGNLVNSSISQATDASIQIITPSLKISNPLDPAKGTYILPSVCGLKDQVLSVKDETTGVLGWAFPSGGGGSGSDPRFGNLSDRKIPFWNNTLSVLEDSPLEYTAANNMHLKDVDMTIDKQLSVLQGMQLDGNLSGNNNVLLNDLPDGHVFIGDPSNKAQARILSGDLSVDNMGVVSLTEKDPKIGFSSAQATGIMPYWDAAQEKLVPAADLVYESITKDLKLNSGTLFINDYALPRQKGAENQEMVLVGAQLEWVDKPQYTLYMRNDSLILDSSQNELSRLDFTPYENLWEKKNDAISNKEIGGNRPSSLLFLSDINAPILSTPAQGAGTRLMWLGERSALRAGTVTGTEWDLPQIGFHSTALGRQTQASGDDSFVLGAESKATAEKSFSLGYQNEVEAVKSFGMGINNKIRSTLILPSMAIGTDNTINASSSIAFGRNITIENKAEQSLMIASKVQSNQAHSIALLVGEDDNKIEAGNDGLGQVILIGKDLTSMGDRILNMGFGNNLSADDASESMAIGYDIVNKSKKVISLGQNLGSDYTSDESLIFGFNYKLGSQTWRNIIIGNGALGAAPAQTTLNYAEDNVLIGHNIEVAGTSSGVSVNNSVNIGFNIKNNVRDIFVFGQNLDLTANPLGIANPLMLVGNGSYALQLSRGGDLHLKGDVYARNNILSSDIRLKEAVKPLSSSLALLGQLQGVSYIFKDDEKAIKRFGFIAQEVEGVFPNLVHKNQRSGMLSVDYIGFIPILWELVKIQKSELDKKDAEIENLKQEIQKIKAYLGL